MGRGVRRAQFSERIWCLWIIACAGNLGPAFDNQLPDLYSYLGQECGWSPTECDRHPIKDLCRWADACSRRNSDASK